MPITNDGKYIEHISNTTRCVKHLSNEGVPCWAIEGGKPGNFVLGVCGSRIRAAGYNGQISAQSMSLKAGGRGGNSSRS